MSEEVNNILLDQTDGPVNDNTEAHVQERALESDMAFMFEAYTEDNIDNLKYNEKPELITLLGLNDYGKSTFVGSLYQLLRTNEEYLGYSLVDSNTLAGFERRVFLRKVNESGKSDVKRTIRKKGSLLDLKLKNKAGLYRHIVLSDSAGEMYRDCISKDSTVKEQIAVKVADRLLIFVNCEEFLDSTKPWSDDLKGLLSRFYRNDMLPESALVYIVFNKYDKMKGSIDSVKLDGFIREVKTIVSDFFTIEDSNIYRVNSRGIKLDSEDEGLKTLIKNLLNPIPEDRSMYKVLDWLSNNIKNNK